MVIVKNGVKMYPAARWQQSQHKIEYFRIKTLNALDDAYIDGIGCENIGRLENFLARLEDILDEFYPEKDGIVYLPIIEQQFVRRLIERYNALH